MKLDPIKRLLWEDIRKCEKRPKRQMLLCVQASTRSNPTVLPGYWSWQDMAGHGRAGKEDHRAMHFGGGVPECAEVRSVVEMRACYACYAVVG